MAGAPPAAGPGGVWRLVLASQRYRVGFLALSAAATFAYSLLLPLSYTERLSFVNWRYLSPGLAGFSVVFGTLLAWILTLQVYAVRQRLAARGRGVGLGAATVGVLPSLLCCTPVVPTLLGVAGISGVGLWAVSGPVQAFFAFHETEFLVGGAVVLGAAAFWSTRQLGRACCLVAGRDGR